MFIEKKLERKLWVINTGLTIDHINVKLKKHIYLKPKIPLQFPMSIAMEYINKFKDIQICNNPQDYFKDRKLKRLILRDAGIGDLLMLEPVLRKMTQEEKVEVDIACM